MHCSGLVIIYLTEIKLSAMKDLSQTQVKSSMVYLKDQLWVLCCFHLINDMYLLLNESKIILYADDTVVYYAHKDSAVIQHIINNEANKIHQWLRDNNLFINLKKGKTEFLLFGTPQRLKTCSKIDITINNIQVNRTVLTNT